MRCMAFEALACVKANNFVFDFTIEKRTTNKKLDEIIIQWFFKDNSSLLVKYVGGKLVRSDIRTTN